MKKMWIAFFAAALCVACSSASWKLKPAKLDRQVFGDIGAIEIETNPKVERGPNVGSFVTPTFVSSSTDMLISTVGGTFGRMTQTGSFRWKHIYKVGVGSRPVVRGDTVYIGALDMNVYAYNINDGKEKWHKKLSAESMGNLVIGPEHLYVGTGDNVLWALNPDTGQEAWALRRPSPTASYYWSLRGNTAGVLSPDKKALYLGFSDGVIVALNASTGETLWERSFVRSGRFQDADSEPVLSPDGRNLFIALVDHSIQVLNTADGSSIESFGEASGFVPYVNFQDNTMIYSTMLGTLRKYALPTKKLLWETDVTKDGLAGEVQLLNKDYGVFASTRFGLHVIDLDSGKILASHYAGEGLVSRPNWDGSKLYVMTGRGRLLIYRIDLTALTAQK